MIVDWHIAFSGVSTIGEKWTNPITKHKKSGRLLAETDWKSEAWQKKYPMGARPSERRRQPQLPRWQCSAWSRQMEWCGTSSHTRQQNGK